jgi:hypothetical protein
VGAAAEDQHLAGQHARTGCRVDAGRPIQPATLKEDRLVRQPFEPATGRCRQLDADAAVIAQRAIDLLRRLRRGQRVRAIAGGDAHIEPVATNQPARRRHQHGGGQAGLVTRRKQHPQRRALVEAGEARRTILRAGESDIGDTVGDGARGRRIRR